MIGDKGQMGKYGQSCDGSRVEGVRRAVGGAAKGRDGDGPVAAGGCEEGGDGGDQSKEKVLKVSQY
jgi:hypothetical protein